MKAITTLLFLIGNAGYADAITESHSGPRCAEKQIFVEKSLEDEPCTPRFPTEEQKQILISSANESAASRCSGQLEILEDYQFYSRSSCWSGGHTIHTVRVTFECQST